MMSEKKTGLSAFTLKLIALALMTVDHIGFFIPGAPFVFRMLGRLSAPVFFFTAAHSLRHTSNRTLFILRLYIASAVMELTKMIVFFFDADSRFAVTNNIFTTLFLSVFIANGLLLSLRSLAQKEWRKCSEAAALAAFPVLWTLVAPVSAGLAGWTLKSILPTLVQAEGGVTWVLLGVGFGLFAGNRKALVIFLGAFCSFLVLQVVQYSGFASLVRSDIQWMMIFALPLLLLYNGEKGPGLKWLFYAYYPLHIWLLYFIGHFARMIL